MLVVIKYIVIIILILLEIFVQYFGALQDIYLSASHPESFWLLFYKNVLGNIGLLESSLTSYKWLRFPEWMDCSASVRETYAPLDCGCKYNLQLNSLKICSCIFATGEYAGQGAPMFKGMPSQMRHSEAWDNVCSPFIPPPRCIHGQQRGTFPKRAYRRL